MVDHCLFVAVLFAFLAINTQGNLCTSNTFQITGNGKVSVNPDIVSFTVSATSDGDSASLALSNLNLRINSLLKTFNATGIPPANYSTSGININEVYNYSMTPTTIIGSEATQSLSVTLGNTKILTQFLQAIGDVNATVSNLVFDLYDKQGAFKLARRAAITDARNKLNDYLSLTSLREGGLKKINDLNSEVYTPYQSDPNLYALYSKLRNPPSPVQIFASVEVTWKVQN
jgi:uncharacterized protein YggE